MTKQEATGVDLSKELAQQLMAITPETLSKEDVEQVERLLLDYAGVTYGGAFRPWIVALHEWAKRYDGSGPAGLVGGVSKVAAPIAALVNGAAAHSFELDDTHGATLSHPGSVVIAAALAVGAETKSSGAEIFAAIVAGYEAIARIGVAANAGRVMKFGYHPTPVFGGFGAAATAAKLHGLDVLGLLHAWGHVLSLCGGSMQFSDETAGADVKRLHGGYAAHNGILGAEMAKTGIQGPRRALDGKYGFLTIYGRETRPDLLLAKGNRLAIHETSMKPYACCRQFHAMIDCLGEATDNFAIAPSSIKSILVRGPKSFREQHLLRRPASSTAAQYSLPFVIGATLEFGPLRWDAYEPQNLGNPKILSWADAVDVVDDSDLEAHFPDHYGAEVQIELTDGQRRSKRLLDGLGAPTKPFSWQDLLDKTERVTTGVKSAPEIADLARAIREAFAAPNVELLNRELMNRELMATR